MSLTPDIRTRHYHGLIWYYVQVDDGVDKPIRETILVSSVDLDEAEEAYRRSRTGGITAFRKALARCLRANEEDIHLSWEKLSHPLLSARPHEFRPEQRLYNATLPASVGLHLPKSEAPQAIKALSP